MICKIAPFINQRQVYISLIMQTLGEQINQILNLRLSKLAISMDIITPDSPMVVTIMMMALLLLTTIIMVTPTMMMTGAA